MYLMFGTQVQDDRSTRIAPLTDEVFSPDISVLNQKLIRAIYPNSTLNFLSEILSNNGVSELKIYPSIYINNDTIPTSIDPLLHFLESSNQVINVKYKPESDLFGDVINSEVTNIMNQGLKLVKKNNQLEDSFTTRTVKLKAGDSSKLIVAQIALKLMINNSMYVSLFQPDDDEDALLIDLIMQNTIYFKTTDLSKYKLAYRVKIGELDLETTHFKTLMTYKPEILDINFTRRQDTRLLQVPVDAFLTNVFDVGSSAVSAKLSQQTLVNRKQMKIKS